MNSGESLDSQSLPGGIFPEHIYDFSVDGKAAEGMETNEQRILDLIRKGEGLNPSSNLPGALDRDVYETVCALNRHGGTILLGVQDSGEIAGIAPDALARIRKDFVTAVNNPQSSFPDVSFDRRGRGGGQTLLRIYVPESSRCIAATGASTTGTRRRSDITDHTRRWLCSTSESRQPTARTGYPYIRVEDLRRDLIEKCRRIVRIDNREHPWADMDDLRLLRSAQLYQTDPLTRESGVTLAGVLLFAPDQLLLNICPAHRTDLILRKVDVDRYDDRDLVRTNLIDSYDRILAFVRKHLPDPFHLEGIERVSQRHHIPEVASNMLIHREYTSGARPAHHRIRQSRHQNAIGLTVSATWFVDLRAVSQESGHGASGDIIRADESRFCMRKMMKYGKLYGGADRG